MIGKQLMKTAGYVAKLPWDSPIGPEPRVNGILLRIYRKRCR